MTILGAYCAKPLMCGSTALFKKALCALCLAASACGLSVEQRQTNLKNIIFQLQISKLEVGSCARPDGGDFIQAERRCSQLPCSAGKSSGCELPALNCHLCCRRMTPLEKSVHRCWRRAADSKTQSDSLWQEGGFAQVSDSSIQGRQASFN